MRRQVTCDTIHKSEPTWWSHLLRHSPNVRYLGAGLSEKNMADFLDWTSMDTVAKYTALGGRKTIRDMEDGSVNDTCSSLG